MVAIAFSVVGGSACLFLTYALVRFNRELRRLHVANPGTIARRIAYQDPTRFTACFRLEDVAQYEVRARREVLVNSMIGFLGVAAPFIVILLLSSSIFHR